MNNNWDRELIAIIKPDGEYELDWQYLEGLSPDVQASQENIYTEYLADCNYCIIL